MLASAASTSVENSASPAAKQTAVIYVLKIFFFVLPSLMYRQISIFLFLNLKNVPQSEALSIQSLHQHQHQDFAKVAHQLAFVFYIAVLSRYFATTCFCSINFMKDTAQSQFVLCTSFVLYTFPSNCRNFKKVIIGIIYFIIYLFIMSKQQNST